MPARERYRPEGPVTPPPAPERRIAAIFDGRMPFGGRCRKPLPEPWYWSCTGNTIFSVRGCGAVTGRLEDTGCGEAAGWFRGRGLDGFEGTGEDTVRSVVVVAGAMFALVSEASLL